MESWNPVEPVQFPWWIEDLEAIDNVLHVYGPDGAEMTFHSHDLELLNWPRLDLPAPDLPS